MAVAGAYFVQGLCFAALVTRVPALQERHHFTDAQLSLVLLAVPVLAGVGSVLAGTLAGRLGSALVLRVAGPLVCAAIAAIGFAGGRPALYGALTLFGLAVGAVDASMNMQGVAVQDRYGRSILASFHAVWSVAGIAGALASSAAAHWRLPLGVALGAVGAVALVIALGVGPRLLSQAETAAADAGPAEGPAAAQIPWRPILLVGVAVVLMYIADSSTSNWSAVYLHKALGASESAAAWAYAAYQLCQVVGRTGADRVVERYGPVRTVAAGGLVAFVGLLVVVLAQAPIVGIAGFGILGLGLCIVVPQSFTVAGRLDPTGSGVAVARVNLFNYVGFVLGAPLVGLVAGAATLRVGFAVPLVLVLGIVALSPAFKASAARAMASR